MQEGHGFFLEAAPHDSGYVFEDDDVDQFRKRKTSELTLRMSVCKFME